MASDKPLQPLFLSGSPPPPPFWRRLLRTAPVIIGIWLMTLLFAHLGILHKLEPAVMDAQMRLTQAPEDSFVSIVSIDDDDYRNLFKGRSPLLPEPLAALIDAIAAGDPAVIVVDVDTSDSQFKDFQLERRHDDTPATKPRYVWQREVRNLPESAAASDGEPLDVLGGKTDLDLARNSLGLAILIEDPEDSVTRRYRRLIATKRGNLPSLPWAAAKAFGITREESTDDLIIRYSGDREGSHRVKLTAAKTMELAAKWPAASPISGKIVLLGGSYLDQDRHETPLGRLTGVEVLANAIETETQHEGGEKPVGKLAMLVLQIFESIALILLFHALPLRWALLSSVALIPVLAVMCSLLPGGSWTHSLHFLPILVGLVAFELYEHVRRTALPRAYEDLVGRSDDSGAHH